LVVNHVNRQDTNDEMLKTEENHGKSTSNQGWDGWVGQKTISGWTQL
jgi:hypothetical protein